MRLPARKAKTDTRPTAEQAVSNGGTDRISHSPAAQRINNHARSGQDGSPGCPPFRRSPCRRRVRPSENPKGRRRRISMSTCPILTDLSEAKADLKAAFKRIRKDFDFCSRCPSNPCSGRIRFNDLVTQAVKETLEEIHHDTPG